MNSDKGKEITSVFRYVQQVYKECQRIFLKLDNLMAPEWRTIYGNRTTKEVTSSLQDPERWLVEAVFRVYEAKEKSVSKGITISFWGNISEPVITAGKITYQTPNERDHWDIWNSWFSWAPGEESDRVLDGSVTDYAPEEIEHISRVKVFSLPLVDIENEHDLEMKIYNPLIAL